MDISRAEQRILHLLAQGGRIEYIRADNRKIISISCFNREGWQYSGIDLQLFRKLKRRKAIASKRGDAYRITKRGLRLVRAELDNR